MSGVTSGIKSLKKDDILFREGDPSDAMYVIKKGQIAITKAKGAQEIILAELNPGAMLGEMAFFDNKPRSAGAKAMGDAEVICLPFNALYAQFKNFPEWLKAMVKTVNTNLRSANQRIKNLEKAVGDESQLFPPHTITRLCGLISLIGFKAGEETEDGLVIPSGLLRNYTIQVFQQPTHKMQKLMEILCELELMTLEDLGEGRQKITLKDHKKFTQFVDWYNKYLFTEESKRTTVDYKELPVIKALVFYGDKETPNDKGLVTVSLNKMQNESMKDLNYVVDINQPDTLVEKGLIQEKTSDRENDITTAFNLAELKELLYYWTIVYRLIQERSTRK